MLCLCRRRSARNIGAWRCYGTARRFNQLPCNYRVRESDADRIKTSCCSIRKSLFFLYYQCKRSRPEILYKRHYVLAQSRSKLSYVACSCNMNYHRVVAWSALCRIYCSDSLFIKCVCSKPVYCFGRECHNSSVCQQPARSSDVFFCGFKDFSFHNLEFLHFLCLILCNQRIYHFIHVSVYKGVEFVNCKADSVIRYSSLREVVCPDSLTSVA